MGVCFDFIASIFMTLTETAVDRQISFPLSNILHVNGEKNGRPLLQDFTEDIQFMDIEETSGTHVTACTGNLIR